MSIQPFLKYHLLVTELRGNKLNRVTQDYFQQKRCDGGERIHIGQTSNIWPSYIPNSGSQPSALSFSCCLPVKSFLNSLRCLLIIWEIRIIIITWYRTSSSMYTRKEGWYEFWEIWSPEKCHKVLCCFTGELLGRCVTSVITEMDHCLWCLWVRGISK